MRKRYCFKVIFLTIPSEIQYTRGVNPLAQGLAASGTTALTHLALVHVPRALVVVREGNEIGHHAQNAVREEFLVSGHSRHHL